MKLELPSSICFRVTRFCNARCGFCLAPSDGSHPSADLLIQRLDWLLDRKVKTIHFCGGEPTIHPALPQLLEHVHARGGTTKLTTNGIKLPDGLIDSLRHTRTQVKVSLHGDRAHHDAMVGREAFDKTTRNIRNLKAAGVRVTLQTTVVAGGVWVVKWVAGFCLEHGLRRLSVLPFIPRGHGNERRDEFGLSPSERRELRALVAEQRRVLSGRLEVRWLDFTARPVHVVEADGRLVLERATEAMDELLCEIPVMRPAVVAVLAKSRV